MQLQRLMTIALLLAAASCGVEHPAGNRLIEVFQHSFSGTDVPGLSGPLSQSSIRSFLRDRGLNERLDVIRLDEGLYQVAFDGVGIAGFQIRAMDKGAPLVIGAFPDIEHLGSPSKLFPSDFDVVLGLRRYLMDDSIVEIRQGIDVYQQLGDELVPARQVVFRNKGIQYQAIVSSNKVLRLTPAQFDVSGTALIFANNTLDSSMTQFTLRDLTDGRSLSSTHFKTIIEAPHTAASSSNATFNFSQGESAFDQTSVFTNANRMLEWFESIGYKNTSSLPINLYVHATLGGTSNNALYQPGSGGSASSIYVGDGDGTVLKNLATDADVVSHELGHHVVYKSITDVSGESLVLHEGIADYFTYARTGNACLGESICPSGSSINCQVDTAALKCLRTADNTLAYGAANLPSEAHLRSQFISGFLWDLRVKDGIDADQVSKTVLSAIDYLVSNSGYRHLVIALLTADKALYASTNCQKIYDRAKARGLGSLISDFGCTSGTLPTVEKQVSSTAGSSSSSSSGSGGLCGTVGGRIGVYNPIFFLLIMAPVIVAIGFAMRRGYQVGFTKEP